MQPVKPVLVTHLFEPLLDQLLYLLRGLSEAQWRFATPCPDWMVKDVALHLLGDEIGKLSGGRDKDKSGFLPPGPDLVSRINMQNMRWVEATRRISTPLLCELLDITGHQVIQYFQSLPLMDLNGTVSWAGPASAPVWLDVAREYTERWHHQQHIREAVQQPGLTEPRFLTPVLNTFVRALPWTFHTIQAPERTTLQLTISGEAGDTWSLVREEVSWSLFSGASSTPEAIVTLDQETAWRLFTKGIAKESALVQANIQGDAALVQRFFETVAIIA